MTEGNVYSRVSERCPLSDSPGIPLRCRRGSELAECYQWYFGDALPKETVNRYFSQDIQEYVSPDSDLRWFSPAPVAGPDFYQLMSRRYSWYYTDATWDKHYARSLFRRLGVSRFVEVGCGDGIFLSMARSVGVEGVGVETNPAAIATARAQGLEVVDAEAFDGSQSGCDALVMLQVLEHVPEPLSFVRSYVSRCNPEKLIIAVPCHETLLSSVSDPLAWPPHHVTMWSEKSFRYLGECLGYDLVHTAYPPMTYSRFVQLYDIEPTTRTPLGVLRERAPGREGEKPRDIAARLVAKWGQWDAWMRERNESGLRAKVIKTLYRKWLRGFAEPMGTKRIGPRWGRLKWLFNRAMGRHWANRDFWILVVLEKRSSSTR